MQTFKLWKKPGLLAALSLCLTPLSRAGSAQRGPTQKDLSSTGSPTALKVLSYRFTGLSASQWTPNGLVLVGLPEVSMRVLLGDQRNRPFTGEVEATVSGGMFTESNDQTAVFRADKGRVRLSFRAISPELPYLLLGFRDKNAPGQSRFYSPTPRIPVVVPARVTLTAARSLLKSDGKDREEMVVRVYDVQGRPVPRVPFFVFYSSPRNEEPQRKWMGRTNSAGTGRVRIPPSKVAGLSNTQACVGSVGTGYIKASDQLQIRFVSDPRTFTVK